MTLLDLEARLAAAARVATEAGHLAMSYYQRREALTVEHKGQQDLVSIADRATEDLIRRELGRQFPEDGFIGEEGGGAARDRVWVIDPIDGTFNFLRGIPCWSVCLAYVADGRIEVGVTYDPVHDELFTARRGHGAFRNGTPIRVSRATDPTAACCALTYSFKMPKEPYVALVDRLIGLGFEHRRMGSTAVKLCWVADGRMDALVSPYCASWDALSGLLLVNEAGGRATDWPARHGLLDKAGILAATPALIPALEAASGLRL